MLLGCHLSIAKGFVGAVRAAEDLGNSALQVFSHNASAWRMRPLRDEDADAFREACDASQIAYVVIHTTYLLNLASPDEALYEKSIAALEQEFERAGRLGADALVTHLGAHRGAGTQAGIDRIVAALDRVLASRAVEESSGVLLLLEDTAGAGTTMGTDPGELSAIVEALSDARRIGICLDTCHAFAAGLPVHTSDGLEGVVAALDQRLGIDRLALIHLNDSVFPFGSRRDRHAHIGHGHLGEAGIARILNHPALRDLPFILETPKEIDGQPNADAINLARVRALRASKEAG